MKYLVLFDYNKETEHQAFPTREEAAGFAHQLKSSPHNTTIVIAEVLEVHKKEEVKDEAKEEKKE